MKKFNMSNMENMMSNIIAEGQYDVWQDIEDQKNALERCKQRKLFWEALRRINKGN